MGKFTSFIQWANVQLFFIVSVVFAVMFGVYSSNIIAQLGLTQAQFGMVAGVFFVCYALIQFYSGKLLVILPAKLIISISALISALGCFVLTIAHSLFIILLARALLGVGLAVTYVAVLFVVQKKFSSKNFALMSSLSQGLANLAGAIFAFFGSVILEKISYPHFFLGLAVVFLICGFLILVFVNNKSNQNEVPLNSERSSLLADVISICSNSQVWCAILYFTGLFGAVLSFANLFSNIYQESAFLTTISDATTITSMILLGVTIGSVCSGIFANWLRNYVAAARMFALIGLLGFIAILFVHFPSKIFMQMALVTYFVFGFGLGGSVLAFQCIQENVASENLRPLATSFVLTVSYVFVGFVEQPVIGYILSKVKITTIINSNGVSHNSILLTLGIHDNFYKYSLGLSVILITLIISFISSFYLKRNR